MEKRVRVFKLISQLYRFKNDRLAAKRLVKIPETRDQYIVSRNGSVIANDASQGKLALAQLTSRLQSVRDRVFSGLGRMMEKPHLTSMEPPECVRGMTVLNRDLFRKKVKIPGFKIPAHKISLLKNQLKLSVLKVPKIKPVAELLEDDVDRKTHRMFLLNPEVYQSVEDLEESDQQLLKKNDISCDHFEMFEVLLTYENWSVTDILRAVLPMDADNVTGFSIIGHIAHFNLKPVAFPYKHLIGEVVIDKISNIRTVVNKLDVIDSTFRNFKMELLAGDDDLITQTRENGCIYEFDFSKVYWNPRLGTEHNKMIEMLKKEDVVYDMFAGVGPFAIPAGKRGITVHGNDLNPHSFESLKKNITLNKIKPEIVIPYNLDGREFVRTVMKSDLLTRLKSKEPHDGEMHVLMNLPASAVLFLDCFVSLLSDTDLSDVVVWKLPIVHCYCFSKSDEPAKDAQNQVEITLGRPVTEDASVRSVRNVAPNKEMMCITFRLTRDILCEESKESNQGNSDNMTGEPDAKRPKIS